MRFRAQVWVSALTTAISACCRVPRVWTSLKRKCATASPVRGDPKMSSHPGGSALPAGPVAPRTPVGHVTEIVFVVRSECCRRSQVGQVGHRSRCPVLPVGATAQRVAVCCCKRCAHPPHRRDPRSAPRPRRGPTRTKHRFDRRLEIRPPAAVGIGTPKREEGAAGVFAWSLSFPQGCGAKEQHGKQPEQTSSNASLILAPRGLNNGVHLTSSVQGSFLRVALRPAIGTSVADHRPAAKAELRPRKLLGRGIDGSVAGIACRDWRLIVRSPRPSLPPTSPLHVPSCIPIYSDP